MRASGAFRSTDQPLRVLLALIEIDGDPLKF